MYKLILTDTKTWQGFKWWDNFCREEKILTITQPVTKKSKVAKALRKHNGVFRAGPLWSVVFETEEDAIAFILKNS